MSEPFWQYPNITSFQLIKRKQHGTLSGDPPAEKVKEHLYPKKFQHFSFLHKFCY